MKILPNIVNVAMKSNFFEILHASYGITLFVRRVLSSLVRVVLL